MPIITLRVPVDLHHALRREAHERCTSLNKLCIAKVRNGLNRTQVNADGQLLEVAVTPGAAPGAVAWPGGNIPGLPAKLPPVADTGGDVACWVPGVLCGHRRAGNRCTMPDGECVVPGSPPAEAAVGPLLPACGLPKAPCGWRQEGNLCHLPGEGPCPTARTYTMELAAKHPAQGGTNGVDQARNLAD